MRIKIRRERGGIVVPVEKRIERHYGVCLLAAELVDARV